MKEFKYIRTMDDKIILFPMEISHDTFKRFLPRSAGFCKFVNGKFICYGESMSLEISSHSDDTYLTNHYFINKQKYENN